MDDPFPLAMIAGVSIGAAAAYLGSLMLTRRMALVAGPLGHLTLPGIALALIWGFDVSLGALGDISKAGAGDTALTVVASLAIILVARRTYPRLVLADISEDLAASEGIDVERYNLLYLFLIAVVVALGVKMVGGLLTAALVAVPPSAARNIGKNLKQYTLAAALAGIASAAAGIMLFRVTGLPAGPLIILVSAALFVLSLPFAGQSGAS